MRAQARFRNRAAFERASRHKATADRREQNCVKESGILGIERAVNENRSGGI